MQTLMSSNEIHEFEENAERGAHDLTVRPFAFTMSFLALLVAVTTVEGHRLHTSAVLEQNRANDQWNLYAEKRIRSYATALETDQFSVEVIADKTAAARLEKAYADHQAKWANDLKEEQEKATALEAKVAIAEAHADRFDLAEALLEIGLFITSIALLTRERFYWYLGIAFSVGGILSAASVLLIK
jgi:hypothetical protein